jgi:nitroimidazol reductase NimA-like FMN-containing flavoprotein (pyridoxamine 5'-phosphate oxidase superfamily)
MPTSRFKRTDRTRVRRLPKRGQYDKALIHAIIDESLICHVGFVDDGMPSVIPTAIAREDDRVFVHGNRLSRMLKTLAEGAPACITVTLIDGLVVARSGFHHSMNYRSVVIYGSASPVTGEEKHRILDLFVEQIIPGRGADVRPATRKEVNATTVLAFNLDECSAKVRTGPPVDDEEDYELPIWAGEIPLRLVAGHPVDDPRLAEGIDAPEYVKKYVR